jgi:hypothetical protein
VGQDAREIIEHYTEADEVIREVFAGYSGSGLRRRVLGVTAKRVIVVNGGYGSVKDKGLLWQDPVEQVALLEEVAPGLVKIQRSTGRFENFNPTSSFFGGKQDFLVNVDRLFAAIPGRC